VYCCYCVYWDSNPEPSAAGRHTDVKNYVALSNLNHVSQLVSSSHSLFSGARGSIVVTALCYKPGGPCSIPDEVIFKIDLILPTALCPGVYSACNRNEYQKYKNNFSGEYSEADA
jgi:hypothetical protein